jgi:hypothetical protein
MQGTEHPAALRHARLKLLLMFLMPALAVILASVVFFTGIGLPRATINKGVLLQPPRQLDELQLRDARGEPWRYAAGKRGWGMLVTGGGACDAACRERVTLTRQVRAALGKDIDRLQRYYLATEAAAEPGFAAWLSAEQSDLEWLAADAAGLRTLLGAAPADPDPLASGAIYLVDPRGFVMMYYLPSHPGRATLDDLRFLLRNSPD